MFARTYTYMYTHTPHSTDAVPTPPAVYLDRTQARYSCEDNHREIQLSRWCTLPGSDMGRRYIEFL